MNLRKLAGMLTVAFTVLLGLTGSARAQYTISLGNHTSLSYQETTQRIPCTPNGTQWYAQNTTFSNFVFTDATGTQHPLTGSTYYVAAYGDNRDNCPPAYAQPIQLSAPTYSIYFVPNSGAVLTGLAHPQYEVLSVLYAPPGNSSSSGYTTSTSNGTLTSSTSNISSTQGYSIGASGGFIGTGSIAFSFSASNGSGTTNSFQETRQNTTGAQLKSTRNPVDHTQDQFYIWLNPEIAVVGNGANAGQYAMQTPAGQAMDVVNINAQDLMNPSQIPQSVLLPQTISGSSYPGLASICAHPLPPAQCTQANACGCVTADFQGILGQDPLIGTMQTTLPPQVDSDRYVLTQAVNLQGPQCAGCDPILNSFSVSDASSTTVTKSTTDSYTVGVSDTVKFDIGIFSASYTNNNGWTWSNTKSTGSSNGNVSSLSVTLGSSSVNCSETINIYEDTVFHTFAFAPSAVPPAACN